MAGYGYSYGPPVFTYAPPYYQQPSFYENPASSMVVYSNNYNYNYHGTLIPYIAAGVDAVRRTFLKGVSKVQSGLRWMLGLPSREKVARNEYKARLHDINGSHSEYGEKLILVRGLKDQMQRRYPDMDFN
jgi:hypothetical protein